MKIARWSSKHASDNVTFYLTAAEVQHLFGAEPGEAAETMCPGGRTIIVRHERRIEPLYRPADHPPGAVRRVTPPAAAYTRTPVEAAVRRSAAVSGAFQPQPLDDALDEVRTAIALLNETLDRAAHAPIELRIENNRVRARVQVQVEL